MDKKMKKFISMVLVLGILNSSVTVFALDVNKTDSNVQTKVSNVDSLKRVVEFSNGNNSYKYDAENELLEINDDIIIKFETKVEYLNPDMGITEKEALENEKDRIFNNLTQMNNGDLQMRNSRNQVWIPDNDPYVVSVNFSKHISDIYGNLGDCLSHISALTTVTSLLGLPYSSLLAIVGTATGLSSYAIGVTKGYIGGEWYYTQHRTTKMYQYYNSYQYGYRYAHSGISLSVRVNGNYYTPYSSYYSVGGWWFAQNPF